jgi:glutamate 5-kinase
MIAVVKVGTSSITSESGELDEGALAELCAGIAASRAGGHDVVLVSSGAIAAGLPALGLGTRPVDVRTLQAVAAVGQPLLMERLGALLGAHTKKISHPSELLEKNQEVRCKVLSVDQERRRIALGLKQLADDPWATDIPGKYQPNQVVKG